MRTMSDYFESLLTGCTPIRLIHMVLWGFDRMILKEKRCALPDILSSGSDTSAQKVIATDRTVAMAATAHTELLEECVFLSLQSVTRSRK